MESFFIFCAPLRKGLSVGLVFLSIMNKNPPPQTGGPPPFKKEGKISYLRFLFCSKTSFHDNSPFSFVLKLHKTIPYIVKNK